MKTPGIGELRERLAIRLWREIPNDAMGSNPSYGEPVWVWGKVRPVSATVYYGAKQVDDTVTHRITLRAGVTITPAHVIEWSGRRFRVRRQIELGDTRRFVTVEVEETEAVP